MLVAVFVVVPVVAVLVVTLLSAPLAGFAVALFGVAFTLWPGWTATRGAILILPSARVAVCMWLVLAVCTPPSLSSLPLPPMLISRSAWSFW